MRLFLSMLGIMAALVMAGVSASMNYLFLSSLGKTQVEAQVLGAASAAADLLKCLLPFFIAWSWRARRIVAASSGLIVFVFFSGFSLLSAIGFAADTRGHVTEGRAVMRDAYVRMQQELSAAGSRLSALSSNRPAGVVEGDIRAHQQNRRWQSTKGCTDATETASRAYCARYFALRGELAAGEERSRLESEMTALREKAVALRNAGAGQAADPQVSLLARIFTADQDRVRLALIVVIALLVETGSSLGLFLASGHSDMWKRRSNSEEFTPVDPAVPMITMRPVGCIEDYCLEALEPADSGSLTLMELYRSYHQWCMMRGLEPMDESNFNDRFTDVATAIDLVKSGDCFQGIARTAIAAC